MAANPARIGSIQSGIELCNACAAACDYAVADLLASAGSVSGAWVMLCIDAAQSSRMASSYLSRGSTFARMACELCATVCTECADAARQHPGPCAQQCAEACADCAAQCRAIVSARHQKIYDERIGGPYAG